MTAASVPELKAIADLLDELDYYEVLEISREVPASAVRMAYHTTSRRFHPDRHRSADAGARRAVARIAKRVSEAYSVLRDPRRRNAYDRRLQEKRGSLRMQLAEAVEADRRASQERTGTTSQGRRYAAMAQADIARGDLASACRNLQMAVTYEGGNEYLKEKLAEVRRQLR